MKQLLKSYVSEIFAISQHGDAREESYYAALKDFLDDIASALNRTIQITVLPKQTEAGNPDFRVWDGAYRVIGYIEAKAPGAKLDQVETSEQLQRYLRTFPNLILTDFCEFRLYRNGMELKRALIASPFIAGRLKTAPPLQQVEELTQLLQTFFSFTLSSSLTAEDLARELARRTRFLRDDVIRPELAEQVKQKRGDLYGFYEAFQKHLIAGLTEAQFADLYAQTITYGLFVARTRAEGKFNRKAAYDLIPSTIGILRDVFQFISLGKPSPQMETIVDDIAAVLNAADVQAILTQYYRQGKGDDPILHFYETFLAEYDPETRERRGVYYTPQSVVRYIVRAVHDLLQTRFGLQDGLADSEVTLLDPAAGTLTFPAEAVQLALETYTNKYGEGGKANFLRSHLLPHFYAFELLMAPYAIGHMKIAFLLESLHVPLPNGKRFQFYLTNALEMEDLPQTAIPGLSSLSEESHHAAKVKKERPILVILGNPPYSGISANASAVKMKIKKGGSYVCGWQFDRQTGGAKPVYRQAKRDLEGVLQPTFIGRLIRDYYFVDGQPLKEKNPKWLQDDYVKFLRFAQWKVEQAGHGIVAMITNHSYLDNPTFRGMRQSLLRTFDEIYILDLHGNALKRETAPDGGPDENVFDIRQGVAIGIFVKHNNPEKRGVYHADLYGKREDKYNWLESHTLETAGYQPITPESPFYFFIPRQTQNLQAYLSWPQITEIFPLNGVGMTTARDDFVIDSDSRHLLNRIRNFKHSDLDDEGLHQAFGIRVKKGWSIRRAWKELQGIDEGQMQECIQPVLYRPFDMRYIFYHDAVVWRTARRVMRHMLAGENLGLITVRQVAEGVFNHAFITGNIVESRITLSNKGIAYVYPLYLYPSDMFQQQRRPNLADWLLPQLTAAYGFTPTPEEVLAYIYAVFYSPTYRQKYAQELRTDFPRVPFTADGNLFRQMAGLGRQLIDLHLLRSSALAQPSVKYQGQGNNDTVEEVRYDGREQRVYINANKYFEGVTPEMWEYQIGGYQVLAKYLKDRRGRRIDDPVPYTRIATAIARTIDIQREVDQIYPQVESNILVVRRV